MAHLPHQRKSSSWLPRWFNPRSDLRSLPGSDSQLPKGSRLQRRLKSRVKRDRIFLSVLRRRHAQTSRLNQRLNTNRSQYQLWQRTLIGLTLGLTVGGGVWSHLFINGKVTLAGVPYQIVDKFWSDKAARDAYFIGDRQALHDRLKTLGIEADIKDYYRDRFDSESELDHYIHQLMFNRTGYVGEAYRVNNFGELISIEY